MVIEAKFVRDLGRALNLRHISEGIAVLNKAESALANMPPTHPHATEVLLLVAQWVDVGYQNQNLLDSLLEKFPLDVPTQTGSRGFPAGAHGRGISSAVG